MSSNDSPLWTKMPLNLKATILMFGSTRIHESCGAWRTRMQFSSSTRLITASMSSPSTCYALPYSHHTIADHLPIECSCSKLYFMACMFSKKERKQDYMVSLLRYPAWNVSTNQIVDLPLVQIDMEISTDPQKFEVGSHIHCNKLGKTVCGKWIELTPPPPTKVDIKLSTTWRTLRRAESNTLWRRKLAWRRESDLKRKIAQEMAFEVQRNMLSGVWSSF